jgi:predicted metal-binding membrane protein
VSTALSGAGGGGSTLVLRRLRGGQLVALLALLGLAAVAWVVSGLRMAGMDAGPGTDPGTFGFYLTTWVVMMAAMMFPSIAPMVLMYRSLTRGQRARGAAAATGSTGLFVTGYLAVWLASGLLAYAVYKTGRAVDGGLFGWHRAGRWTAAAILLGAAVYEFTPLKNACLMRCRSPLGFLLGSWRDGRGGALRMGLGHGSWCLGCCWLLMVVLFALGVMSLIWMIVITSLIAAEKLLPTRLTGIGIVAVVLAALAIGVAAAPQDVPGLTIPGSPAAMRAMETMGGSMRMTGSMDHSMKSSMDHSMKVPTVGSRAGMGTMSGTHAQHR